MYSVNTEFSYSVCVQTKYRFDDGWYDLGVL